MLKEVRPDTRAAGVGEWSDPPLPETVAARRRIAITLILLALLGLVGMGGVALGGITSEPGYAFGAPELRAWALRRRRGAGLTGTGRLLCSSRTSAVMNFRTPDSSNSIVV